MCARKSRGYGRKSRPPGPHHALPPMQRPYIFLLPLIGSNEVVSPTLISTPRGLQYSLLNLQLG
ncbi:hypothetical protein B0J17DRAFT_684443, partial [Rhizoctonia solani]